MFEKLNLGNGGAITLIRSDGRLIARVPFNQADVDRDLSQSPVFKAFLAKRNGHYVGAGGIDGVERLFTFRSVRGLPFILTVNVSVDNVLAAWRAKAIVNGAILLVLSAATMALCLLFRLELQRRAEAEHALEIAAVTLSQMAAVDAMTGLSNRRTFEEKLQAEWRRAIETQEPIGLLMLDADFFKLYNDRYGHPEGDRVLRSIAGCLKAYTRTRHDVAARYGGEEFVLILRRADAAATLQVAERIRVAVEGLVIAHADSPIGRVTVSVGVAIARPTAGSKHLPFLKAADEALYTAKGAGRNRVVVAGSDPAQATRQLIPRHTGHDLAPTVAVRCS